jgi:hypothetical protein
MPEDLRFNPLTSGIGYVIFNLQLSNYGIKVEVVVVVGQIVVVVEVVVTQELSLTTVPRPASNTASIAAAIPLTAALGAAMITIESSMI